MHKRLMWNLVAVVITLLVISTSAWADITGFVYRLDGNYLNAGPIPAGATLEGTFTAPSVNFIVPEAQGTTDALSEFLFSGAASYSSMAGLNDVMSNCPQGLPETGDPSVPCYSTAIDIVGSGRFVQGETYTITHDDGVVMSIAGNPFIDAAGPVASTATSATFTDATGTYGFEIWYMATNGNPEVLQSDIPVVPDGGVTLMLLGGALVGLETLRRKFRL